jgi:hypothetical protein
MNTRGFTYAPGIYNPVNTTPIKPKHGLLQPAVAAKLYHRQTWRPKAYVAQLKAKGVTPASTPSFSAQYGRGRKKRGHKKVPVRKQVISGSFE